jgi:hypothetical protein
LCDEFTQAHQGCSAFKGSDGQYRSGGGDGVADRVTLVWCDLPWRSTLPRERAEAAVGAGELIEFAFDQFRLGIAEANPDEEPCPFEQLVHIEVLDSCDHVEQRRYEILLVAEQPQIHLSHSRGGARSERIIGVFRILLFDAGCTKRERVESEPMDDRE